MCRPSCAMCEVSACGNIGGDSAKRAADRPALSSPCLITGENTMDALLSGSECSTSSNPLSQLLKQQQTDHSLHQSQFATPSSAAPSTSIRQPLQQARHNAEAQKFFQGPAQPQHAFNLEALHRELPGAQQQQQQQHSQLSLSTLWHSRAEHGQQTGHLSSAKCLAR